MIIKNHLKTSFNIEEIENLIIVKSENQRLEIHTHSSINEINIFCRNRDECLLLKAIEYLFAKDLKIKQIKREDSTGIQTITREEFFQYTNIWQTPRENLLRPEKWNRNQNREHPIREDVKDGILYRRFAFNIGKEVTIRGLNIATDIETFHRWQNQPRVSHFWELAKSMEELEGYLGNIKVDPHMIPTFVELDGIPVAYFELYWTTEDRLGPYYDADAYDRGFHFLVGEEKFLGFENTDTIVKSVLHFLFLDDPRTRRVMAEPRADNKKVLKYVESSGWRKLKEFDFPHKRAALLEVKREVFFNGERL